MRNLICILQGADLDASTHDILVNLQVYFINHQRERIYKTLLRQTNQQTQKRAVLKKQEM